MTTLRHCPQCGAELPADAPDGVCPKCLVQQGFASRTGAAGEEPGGPGSTSRPVFVAPSPEELSARFPQFDIVKLVGQGGMGAVYKARQPALDRFVALKILPPEVGDDPAFAERFKREARALAMLSHSSIVTVYDFGEADGLYYFVMEYVDGTNLRQTIAHGGADAARGAGDRAADLRRAAGRARRGRGAPRHQAGERADRQAGPREDHRLRLGQAAGRGHRRHRDREAVHADRHGAGHGHGALHGARADAQLEQRRPPGRHLLSGRRVLRDADGRAPHRSVRAPVEEGADRRPPGQRGAAVAGVGTRPAISARERRGRPTSERLSTTTPGALARPRIRETSSRLFAID